MLEAIVLSQEFKFNNDGTLKDNFDRTHLTNFAVTDTTTLKTKRLMYHTENKLIREWVNQLPLFKWEEFEVQENTEKIAYHIKNETNWDMILEEEVNRIKNTSTNLPLNKIIGFSASKFKSGRANMMWKQISQAALRHKKDHFSIDLLLQLINQQYCFNNHFKQEKINSEYQLKDIKVKWSKYTINGYNMPRPHIKTGCEPNWQPAHFTEIRQKTIKYETEVDKCIIELISRKSVMVLGRKDDKTVLKYAYVISPLHVVQEFRFNPLIRDYSLRLRVCLDQFLLNDATILEPFKLITGQELTLSIDQVKNFVSFDNKASFYNQRLGPAAYPYLCFIWKDLILCYTVPAFGLTNSPTMNEASMHLWNLEFKYWADKTGRNNLRKTGCTWIDDTIIGIDEKITNNEPYELLNLAALIFLRLGITPNVQKSELFPTQRIKYLGLELHADTKTFKIQNKLIIDLQASLIDYFKIDDPQSMDIILHKDFTFVKNYKTNELDIENRTLTYKIIEKIIGKVAWANRVDTLDVEIFAIWILYRYKAAWKHEKLIKIALQQVFQIPYLINSRLNKDQEIFPLTINTYTVAKNIFSQETTKQSDNWQGLKFIDLENTLSNRSKNGKPWIRDTSKLDNEIQEIINFFAKPKLENPANSSRQIILKIWVKDASEIFFAPWSEDNNSTFQGLQVIKQFITQKWGISPQFKFLNKNPKPPNPNYLTYPGRNLKEDVFFSHTYHYKQAGLAILGYNSIPNKDTNNCSLEVFQNATFWQNIPKKTKTIIFNSEDPRNFNAFKELIKNRHEYNIVWLFKTRTRFRLAQAITFEHNPHIRKWDSKDWKEIKKYNKIGNLLTHSLTVLIFGNKNLTIFPSKTNNN